MTKNNRQSTIDGLTAMGWTIDEQYRDKKYIQFKRLPETKRMRVGKSGALRMITSGKTDISLTNSNIHKATIKVGKQSGSWTSTDQALRAYLHYQSEARSVH